MTDFQVENPFALFADWLEEAKSKEINDPTAMALATVDQQGLPDLRMVLMKDHGSEGFVFYTNVESAKGCELLRQPKAALLFHWKSLRRQVRVRGPVVAVSAAEADAYFASRPRHSQIGAWASDQSRPLDERSTLEARVARYESKFGADPVPRPPHWSGFRIVPQEIEFWKDGAYRLHDRLLCRRESPGGVWRNERLYP